MKIGLRIRDHLVNTKRRNFRFFSTANNKTIVLGCGSNVIDLISHVASLPKLGQKGFVSHPRQLHKEKLVGGVTLNHLVWASTFGVPTGLLALQGTDAYGEIIRNKLNELKVCTKYIQVKPRFATSSSQIYLTSDGDRCIIMAPGSTGEIDKEAVIDYFSKYAAEEAKFITTEISQIPLSGVEALLDIGASSGVLSFLDIDIPPSVAINEAKLGNLAQLERCIQKSRIIKPTLEAAKEILGKSSGSLADIAQQFMDTYEPDLVAVTDGSNGAAIATKQTIAHLIPPLPDVVQIDSTGAGDAFFGGLIAGIYHWGIPSSADEVMKIGLLASAAGATCCESVGALPASNSIKRLEELNPDVEFMNNNSPNSCNILHSAAVGSILSNMQALQATYDDLCNSDSIERYSQFMQELLRAIKQKNRRIFISGIGKSGIVGQRFSSTLSSISVPSQYVHACEWGHGELGNIVTGDIVIVFSHSGNTPELKNLPFELKEHGAIVLSIVGQKDSDLYNSSHQAIVASAKDSILDHVPSNSIIVQEAVSNSIISTIVEELQVKPAIFTRNHPGGSIGSTMSKNL